MTDHEVIQKIRHELLMLKGIGLLMTSVFIVVWFTGYTTKGNKQHFHELDVERLNILDTSGRYCFVLTNGSRAPGAVIAGKEIRRSLSNNTPAILFYNEEGDESGALQTAGRMKKDGSYYGSSRLVFDRFRRDEMLAFQYYEDPVGGYAGMSLQDTRDIFQSEYVEGNDSIRSMPNGPAKTEALQKFRDSNNTGAGRLFIGKNRKKAVIVDLRDKQGTSRLRLLVDSLGTPRLDFLDENGQITYTLPDSPHAATKR